MRKGIFLFNFFFLITSSIILSAQNIERITYIEINNAGTYGRTITVNAMLVGWEQHQITMEGNYRVVYTTSCQVGGEWGSWNLLQREPYSISLRQQYDAFLAEYSRVSNTGMIFPFGNINALRMCDIPRGQSKPIWWGQDGRSFYIFYKIYIIVD